MRSAALAFGLGVAGLSAVGAVALLLLAGGPGEGGAAGSTAGAPGAGGTGERVVTASASVVDGSVQGFTPIEVPLLQRGAAPTDPEPAPGAGSGPTPPEPVLPERRDPPEEALARLLAWEQDPALTAEELIGLLREHPELADLIALRLHEETDPARLFALARALLTARSRPVVRAELLRAARFGSDALAEAALMALHGDGEPDARRALLDAAAARRGGAREAAMSGLAGLVSGLDPRERSEARGLARAILSDPSGVGAAPEALEVLVRGPDVDAADRALVYEAVRDAARPVDVRLHAMRLLAESPAAADEARPHLLAVAQLPGEPPLVRALARVLADAPVWEGPDFAERLERAMHAALKEP